MASMDDFRSALQSLFQAAESRGTPYIEINSGQLHRIVGGYPGPEQRMPSCCKVMYNEQKADDEVISRPASGKGASLTIRYRLPRSATAIFEAPRREKPRINVIARPISPGPEVVGRGRPRMNVAGYDFELICEIAPRKIQMGL